LIACTIASIASNGASISSKRSFIEVLGTAVDLRVHKQEEGRSTKRPSFALNIPRANGIGNVRQALYRNALSLDHLLARAIA
jgi:hypothetical protein